MQRPRLTIRWLMTAVAVVGLLSGMAVWGWGLKQRREYCLRQESSHSQSERFYRSVVKSFGVMHRRQTSAANEENLSILVKNLGWNPHLIVVGEHTYSADALADYYADLTRKNHRVASRPWLPLEPDPPTREYRGTRHTQGQAR
jgi:hypothetical protein